MVQSGNWYTWIPEWLDIRVGVVSGILDKRLREYKKDIGDSGSPVYERDYFKHRLC